LAGIADRGEVAQLRAEESLPRIRKIYDRRGPHYVAAGSCVLVLERPEGSPFFEFVDAASSGRGRVLLSEVSAIEEAT
jgi:hypothetical protein